MHTIKTVGQLIDYLNKLDPNMKLMGAKGASNAPSCWNFSPIADIHIISDSSIFIGLNNDEYNSNVLVIRQK